MPDLLESGKLQLSPEEPCAYRAAAERLHETCEMALDLTQPITVEDWISWKSPMQPSPATLISWIASSLRLRPR